MATWSELSVDAPDLAARTRTLLDQFGVGSGFLATVDPSGATGAPLCPILCDGELHLLVVPGPKRRDLERDGRFGLHSLPCPDDEDAAYLTGRAVAVDDDRPGGRPPIGSSSPSGRPSRSTPRRSPEQGLFRLDLERCMVATTTGHGDPAPRHDRWRA
jgi:hypothetical protein